MKRFFLFLSLYVLVLVGTTEAQSTGVKKTTPAKPATTKTTTSTKPSTGNTNTAKPAAGSSGINQSNYSKVTEYMNAVIDCMNEQGRVITARDKYVGYFYDVYFNGKDYRDLASYLRFNYTSSKIPEACVDKAPPAILGSADVQFFSSSYKNLIESFINITKEYNDISSHEGKEHKFNYSEAEGKAAAEKLEKDIDDYYTIKGSLSKRISEIQKIIFPFSVAKSPNKLQYTNMYYDLLSAKEFARTFTTYEEIQKNKTSILENITTLENTVIKHMMDTPKENSSLNSYDYKNFYEYYSEYLTAAKAIVNGSFTESQLKYKFESVDSKFDDIIKTYNRIMSK